MNKYLVPAFLALLILSWLFLFHGNDTAHPIRKNARTTLKPLQSLNEQVEENEPSGKSFLRKNVQVVESVQPRGWLPEHPAIRLNAGGVEVPIAYESEVSAALESVIIHDLNLIFGHLDSHEFISTEGAPEISVAGKRKRPDQVVKFIGKGRYFPDALLGKIGLMSGGKMVIPSDLVEIYEEAWERKGVNESKYRELMGTLDRLNSLLDKPVAHPEDWFFISEKSTQSGVKLPEISSKQFSEEFGKHRYRQPSILDVFDGAVWDARLKGNLIAKLYVFDSNGEIKNSSPPLIFVKGSWKFFILQPPT